MKITPARSASDGGEIVKIGLVRQPHYCILSESGFVQNTTQSNYLNHKIVTL